MSHSAYAPHCAPPPVWCALPPGTGVPVPADGCAPSGFSDALSAPAPTPAHEGVFPSASAVLHPAYPLSRWKKNVSRPVVCAMPLHGHGGHPPVPGIGSVHCRGALPHASVRPDSGCSAFPDCFVSIQSRIPPFSHPIPSELDSAVLNHRRHSYFPAFFPPFPVLGVLYHLQAEFRSYCKNFQLLPVRILDTSFYFLLPPNDSFHPFPHSFLAFETHLNNVHFFISCFPCPAARTPLHSLLPR